MLSVTKQAPRYSLLQRLERTGQRVWLPLAEPAGIPTQAKIGLEWATAGLRFAEQKVNMLGHDHIAVDVESVTAAHPFQG